MGIRVDWQHASDWEVEKHIWQVAYLRNIFCVFTLQFSSSLWQQTISILLFTMPFTCSVMSCPHLFYTSLTLITFFGLISICYWLYYWFDYWWFQGSPIPARISKSFVIIKFFFTLELDWRGTHLQQMNNLKYWIIPHFQ